MKVVVTGGAGRLGRFACREMVAAGWEVRAVDAVYHGEMPCPLTVVDLLDAERCYEWLAGADAVVHLGNLPNSIYGTPQRVYADNLAMNVNVFQAARDLGVKKWIFASSVQAMGGDLESGSHPRLPFVDLPIDGTEPARPQNTYGLSKAAGEQMLASFAERFDIEAVALRFPLLYEPDHLRRLAWIPEESPNSWIILSFDDAARLILSILSTSLPGFRIFTPSQPSIHGWTAEECLRKYGYDGPLKRPIDGMPSLVDISRITEATGWTPRRGQLTLS